MSGNTVAVGSTGAADIYGGSGSTWSLEATLAVPNAASLDFGVSVSISGNTVVVGAPNADGRHGAAYVYVEPGNGWASSNSPTATLTASDGATGDNFGASVSISGNTVVVALKTPRSAATANRARPTCSWSRARGGRARAKPLSSPPPTARRATRSARRFRSAATRRWSARRAPAVTKGRPTSSRKRLPVVGPR